jgi:hypothetical protein
MPNLWTHNIFGDGIARDAGMHDWLDRSELKQLYHLGCQGPDFLFYHRFLPWQGQSLMNELGTRMHQESCGPVLMQMADAVKKAGGTLADPLTVYVAGFMMHHVLDRNAHPYIFTKSGSRKWDHQRFEVIIDTLMVKRHLGLDTWRTPAWKQIDAGKRLPDAVAGMLQDIALAHYPDIANQIGTEDWHNAYRDMIRAQKLFHDPSGIKRILTFGQIEPLVYKRRNPERDWLNEARAPWRHPAIEHETSTKSFQDLWEDAVRDGRRVIDAAIRFWREGGDEARNALTAEIGNRSYEHGRPLEEGLTIRFEEPIW